MTELKIKGGPKGAYAELERIRQERSGILKPDHVVAEATDPGNPLHDKFEWDDAVAGHKYRLDQARKLIKAFVVLYPGVDQPVPCYVNLRKDRGTDEQGYRKIEDVFSNEFLLESLMEDAMNDLRSFEKKYEMLKALAPVFEAARSVEREISRRTAKKKASRRTAKKTTKKSGRRKAKRS